MAKKLKDLVITKVALVPKGSNPDADITLLKEDDVKKITFDEVVAGHPQGVREALWKVYDLCYAFNNTVYANLSGGKNVLADMEKSIDQFKSAVMDALNEAAVTKGTKESADALQAAVLAKTREFLARHQEDNVKNLEEMSKEELIAHAQELQGKVDKAAEPPTQEPTPEELAKSADLPEPVRKALEASAEAVRKANETAADALAKASASEAVAKAEKDARRLAERTQFVKEELAHLPGKPEDIAKGLIEAEDKMSKESYDLVVTSMKAGSAGIEKSTTEIGVEIGKAATGSAQEKLESIAKELRTAAPTLTQEQAIAKAYEEHPDLYTQMRRGQ